VTEDAAMRTVLCFGDSNTYVTDPEADERLPRHVRWPGVLRAQPARRGP